MLSGHGAVSLTKDATVDVPFNYERAKFAYQKAKYPDKGKPLENNTRCMKREGVKHPVTDEEVTAYAVKLHRTDVVTIYPDNIQKLACNGWETRTTRDRINKYSNAYLFQHNNIMYCRIPEKFIPDESIDGEYVSWRRNEDAHVLFEEDMLINPDGRPMKMDSNEHMKNLRSNKRKIDELCKNYKNALVQEFTYNVFRLRPDQIKENSDCDQCIDLLLNPERDENTAHLYYHMLETHYQPAIVLKAHADHAMGFSYNQDGDIELSDYEEVYQDYKERHQVLGSQMGMVSKRALKRFFQERKSALAREHARHKSNAPDAA